MRPLTCEEMDIVAGGDGTTVTVTGTRSNTGYSPPMFYGGGNGGDGGGGNGGGPTMGGGGGSTPPLPYSTSGASDAANNFADHHVHNAGNNTSTDVHDYQLAHDAIAKLYDFAVDNPNATVSIGNGHTISGSELLHDLGELSITIADAGGGSTGANTAPNAGYTAYAITLNTQDQNSKDYASRFGDAGVNYEIFHEIGHELNGVDNRPAFSDEAAANTAGRSMENALGVGLMAVDPNNGYD